MALVGALGAWWLLWAVGVAVVRALAPRWEARNDPEDPQYLWSGTPQTRAGAEMLRRASVRYPVDP